jgi:hypothetical protein
VLASISLAVQRIYGSLDNPYTSTITFLMVTWTLHKISMLERSMNRFYSSSSSGLPVSVPFKWASILDILLDCVLVSKFLYTGVVIQVCQKMQSGQAQKWGRLHLTLFFFLADRKRCNHHGCAGPGRAAGCSYPEQGFDCCPLP